MKKLAETVVAGKKLPERLSLGVISVLQGEIKMFVVE